MDICFCNVCIMDSVCIKYVQKYLVNINFSMIFITFFRINYMLELLNQHQNIKHIMQSTNFYFSNVMNCNMYTEDLKLLQRKWIIFKLLYIKTGRKSTKEQISPINFMKCLALEPTTKFPHFSNSIKNLALSSKVCK